MDLWRHQVTEALASSRENAFPFIPQCLRVSIKSFPHYKICLKTPRLPGDQGFGFWRVFSRVLNRFPKQQFLCGFVQTQNPLARAATVIERRNRQSCMLADLIDRTCPPFSSWFYGTTVGFCLVWTCLSFMLNLLLLLSSFSFLYFENNLKDIGKYLMTHYIECESNALWDI